jgi:hypothetical protein
LPNQGFEFVTSSLALTGLEHLCKGIGKLEDIDRPYDILHTTFNYPIEYNSLDINGGDFVVQLGSGRSTRPVCAVIDPDSEPNELHTVTLIGYFGERAEGQWPTKISVIGHLDLFDNVHNKIISAKGLELSLTADPWAADGTDTTYP